MKIEGLIALRGQPPQVDLPTAAAVALDLYRLEARLSKSRRERDRNFRLQLPDGRQFVLKFIDHEADQVVVAGQSAALTHIAARNPNLPVPRVIHTRGGEEIGTIPEAISEAVLKLIGNPSRRALMGEAARDWICSHFTDEHVLRFAVSFYESLLKRVPATPRIDNRAANFYKNRAITWLHPKRTGSLQGDE